MYQRILAIFSFIIFVIIVIFGLIYWNGKTGSSAENSVAVASEKGEHSKTTNKLTFNQLKANVKNLPHSVQQLFKEAYINKKQIEVLIIGSPSIGAENGWSVHVKGELENVYGTDFLKIDVIEFDGTSTELLASDVMEEISTSGADVVLLEGFTLKDNSGLVPVETMLSNIDSIIAELKNANPDVGVIIQPPNPIYTATHYPNQVKELKNLAETNNIPYFDHWEKWPDPNSEEILNYLNDESLPNEKGHALWADAVLEYFVAK